MRSLVFFALCALATSARAADPTTELGLELVPWSKKVANRRYESPRDYDSTVKFFRDKLKGHKNIKWTREVSLPVVKYVHLENTSAGSSWHSVNIYELPDRHVRYFILERAEPPPKAVSP